MMLQLTDHGCRAANCSAGSEHAGGGGTNQSTRGWLGCRYKGLLTAQRQRGGEEHGDTEGHSLLALEQSTCCSGSLMHQTSGATSLPPSLLPTRANVKARLRSLPPCALRLVLGNTHRAHCCLPACRLPSKVGPAARAHVSVTAGQEREGTCRVSHRKERARAAPAVGIACHGGAANPHPPDERPPSSCHRRLSASCLALLAVCYRKVRNGRRSCDIEEQTPLDGHDGGSQCFGSKDAACGLPKQAQALPCVCCRRDAAAGGNDMAT